MNGMAFRHLSEAEMEWLKNRRNDSRPDVQEQARQVFEAKFPRQARNEIKQKMTTDVVIFCSLIFVDSVFIILHLLPSFSFE
jgi:hypothetical protein